MYRFRQNDLRNKKKKTIAVECAFFVGRMCKMSSAPEMTNVLECSHEVREFKLQSRSYVLLRTNTLGKCMQPFISKTMRKKGSLLLFVKDCLDIKQPTKVYMPSTK